MNFSMRNFWERTRKIVSNEIRSNTSPIKAALSLCLGVLVGLSPFYGIHTFIVIGLAYLFKLNRPLSLLGSGVTLLPFVPLWIAGGIFMGKLVMPIETAGRVIDFSIRFLSADTFWNYTEEIIGFCRRFFPATVFDKVDEEAGHGVIDGFLQWAVGCSTLAVAGAVLTFAVSYYLLLRRRAALNRKKTAGKAS